MGTVGYSHYAVSGATAIELLNQMELHGPNVNGSEAYASTETTMSQNGNVVQGVKQCQIRNYGITVNFSINLPAAENTASMTPRVRAAWKTFYAFVKRHEETHKAIWLGCARDLEARVKSLSERSCEAVEAKISAMFQSANASCSRKHDTFDRSERARLRAQPLVQLAIKGG